MTWQEAFFRQARSDLAMWHRLNRELASSPPVEMCHALHFLQMACEKLGKAIKIDPLNDGPPPRRHTAIVTALQLLYAQTRFAQRLGYQPDDLRRTIIRVMPIAIEIERLHPNVPAGVDGPNCEYPWPGPGGGDVMVPADHAFSVLNPRDVRFQQFVALIRTLLDRFN